jgi:predicted transcriptional regulator
LTTPQPKSLLSGALLTPAETLAHFRRKDRHSLDRLVERGVVERFNVGGEGNGARYLYRLKPIEPERPAVNQEEVTMREMIRGHGL